MGEIVLAALRWTVRISFWGLMIAAWLVIITFVLKNLVAPINGSLITDSFAMVQIWAPFNISPVIGWLLVGASAFVAYRLAMLAFHFVNMFISN